MFDVRINIRNRKPRNTEDISMANKTEADSISSKALRTAIGNKIREYREQGDGYLFHRKTKSVIINS